jgi:hypothetical protein
LVFERLHLGQAACVAWGAAETSRQKDPDQLPGQRGPDHFSTETTNIHIVIFDALMGTKDMIDESGTHAGNLVCGNGRSHTTAAERHSTFNIPRRDRPGQGDDDIGIVIAGIQLVCTKIHDLEPGVIQRVREDPFQLESSMVRGDSHAHHFPPLWNGLVLVWS